MNMQTSETTAVIHNPSQHYSTKDNPAILMLSDDGMIVESNNTGKKLLDFSSDASGKGHITKLLPLLKKIDLLEKGNERVNPYLRFLSRIGHRFSINGFGGRQFSGELIFSDINHHNQHLVMIMIYPVHY